MITNKGKVLWAKAIGNLLPGAGDTGRSFTGTIKKSTATTLEPAGAPVWKAEEFVGQSVYAGVVAGTVISNTTEVLTVARWESLPNHENEALNRGGATAEPPIESAAFSIASGQTPAAWVAVTANSAEPKATNEMLAGEIKTAEGGLLRALAQFHYIGTNEYEVKVTFTANVKDTVPVTLAKIGIFNAHNGGILMFESLLTATAEIKASGDSVQITDVVTGS